MISKISIVSLIFSTAAGTSLFGKSSTTSVKIVGDRKVSVKIAKGCGVITEIQKVRTKSIVESSLMHDYTKMKYDVCERTGTFVFTPQEILDEWENTGKIVVDTDFEKLFSLSDTSDNSGVEYTIETVSSRFPTQVTIKCSRGTDFQATLTFVKDTNLDQWIEGAQGKCAQAEAFAYGLKPPQKKEGLFGFF